MKNYYSTVDGIRLTFSDIEEDRDGFEYLIEQGQFVKEGTPLIKFDREKIKKAGYRDVTICVISETGNAKNITFETGTTATANKTQVASWEN